MALSGTIRLIAVNNPKNVNSALRGNLNTKAKAIIKKI